jgi:enterobacteria phage integrase
MRDAITEAGLPLDCQPHGLRKTAGRRLAEAGATTRQIMSVLGHTTLSEVERYTRDADQRQLAIEAIAALEGRNRNGVTQTDPGKFGTMSKTKRKSES